MKRNYLILILLTVSAILFLQIGCQEEAKPAEGPGTVSKASRLGAATTEEATADDNQKTPKITFEKVVHDFGDTGPGTKKTGDFRFKNTGDGLLKITKVESCCGVTTKLDKKEYAPGESGVLELEYRASQRPGTMRRQLHVNSNDKTAPRIELTLKANIVSKVSYEPSTIDLSLKSENAGCPEITIKSLDNRPFLITGFNSTGDCITADVNSLEAATEFVLSPKVDIEKLQKNINGLIKINLTHPTINTITITYNMQPEFKVNPPVIIVFNAEPSKPVERDLWILNNYNEDFEIESVSSKNGTINVLSQEKLGNRYELKLEITPPVVEGNRKIFTDVFSVNIKGGTKLEIVCRDFYNRSTESTSD